MHACNLIKSLWWLQYYTLTQTVWFSKKIPYLSSRLNYWNFYKISKLYNYYHNFTASTFTIHMINNWCMAFTGLVLMLQRMSTKIDILAGHQSDEMILLSYNVQLPIKYAIPCVFSNLGYLTYISLIMSHLEWKVWFYQSLMHYYFVSTLPCSESTKSRMQLKSSQDIVN